MAMPAHLEAWWREHPEHWRQRHRHSHGFPADGSLSKQIDWFKQQFLKLADKASTTKERGEFLKLAFMATLKGENALGADEVEAQDQEQMERALQKFEEGRARWQAEESKTDKEGAEIRYLQTTPYRTKDRETRA
jgi:hypothetical protein